MIDIFGGSEIVIKSIAERRSRRSHMRNFESCILERVSQFDPNFEGARSMFGYDVSSGQSYLLFLYKITMHLIGEDITIFICTSIKCIVNSRGPTEYEITTVDYANRSTIADQSNFVFKESNQLLHLPSGIQLRLYTCPLLNDQSYQLSPAFNGQLQIKKIGITPPVTGITPTEDVRIIIKTPTNLQAVKGQLYEQLPIPPETTNKVMSFVRPASVPANNREGGQRRTRVRRRRHRHKRRYRTHRR